LAIAALGAVVVVANGAIVVAAVVVIVGPVARPAIAISAKMSH